ncbi:MAG: hypothetical protein ACTS4V_01250 [Candidatus Hodgkinia cicadicola]
MDCSFEIKVKLKDYLTLETEVGFNVVRKMLLYAEAFKLNWKGLWKDVWGI